MLKTYFFNKTSTPNLGNKWTRLFQNQPLGGGKTHFLRSWIWTPQFWSKPYMITYQKYLQIKRNKTSVSDFLFKASKKFLSRRKLSFMFFSPWPHSRILAVFWVSPLHFSQNHKKCVFPSMKNVSNVVFPVLLPPINSPDPKQQLSYVYYGRQTPTRWRKLQKSRFVDF